MLLSRTVRFLFSVNELGAPVSLILLSVPDIGVPDLVDAIEFNLDTCALCIGDNREPIAASPGAG